MRGGAWDAWLRQVVEQESQKRAGGEGLNRDVVVRGSLGAVVPQVVRLPGLWWGYDGDVVDDVTGWLFDQVPDTPDA